LKKKIKNNILKFKKLKKILDVDNDVIYQHGKFELEIPNIWGCTKITNFDGF
jgi:hypothetical protein